MSIKEWMAFDLFGSKFRAFVHDNRWLILSAFLLAIFSHGYGLFTYSLNIDEEIESFSTARDAKIYILIGRWGTYLLNQLLVPQSVMPYLPTLLAICGIALTAILVSWKEEGNVQSRILFGGLFVTHPIHSQYLAFNTINLYYAGGMVFIALAYLSFKKFLAQPKLFDISVLLSILFFTMALSVYQGLLSLYLLLGIYHLFCKQYYADSVDWKDSLKKFAVLGFIMILGFLLYTVLDFLARHILLNDIKNNTEYLDGFRGWDRSSWKEQLLMLLGFSWRYPLGIGFFGGHTGKALVLLIPALIYFILRKSIPIKKKGLLLVLLGLMALSVSAVMLLNGTVLPVRSFMAIPMLIALVWLLVFREMAPLARSIMLVTGIFLFIHNTYLNTRQQYACYTSWQADRDIANRIIERIYSLDLPTDQEQMEVVFIGKYGHPSNTLFVKADVLGASFFEWDGGNPVRFFHFFKTLGINELIHPSDEKAARIKALSKEVPSWPAKGSVCIIDDVVVVKFSDP